MKADTTEASPTKAIAEELEILRTLLRGTVAHYLSRLEGEIDALENVVNYVQEKNKIDSGKLRDMRDMLTVLRQAESKATKGRRKDIKKIENTLEDLRIITEHWK